MQVHSHSVEIDGPPERAWAILHPPPPPPNADGRRLIAHGTVSIEVLHEGDANGEGLVRTCTFAVPKWLLSKGVGRSFETIVEARPFEVVRYLAVGKPLWSMAKGTHLFEDIGNGRTRVSFEETYEAFNPIAARLFEERVHRFISDNNQKMIGAALKYAARKAG